MLHIYKMVIPMTLIAASFSVYAEQIEEVKVDVIYTLTKFDTVKTARKAALKKAKLKALQQVPREYWSVEEFHGDGQLIKKSSVTHPSILKINVLREGLVRCSKEDPEDKCYQMNAAFDVDVEPLKYPSASDGSSIKDQHVEKLMKDFP